MKFSRALVIASMAALAACGGGGGGDGGGGGGSSSLALSGTAVKGAAIAGATVEGKCATGSGTATTDGTGSFSLTVPGGSLPCTLKVPLGDGSYLHSAIGGAGGGSFNLNVSPLTELVVAQAFGVTPETLFAEFATRSTAVTGTALSAAVTAIRATLAAQGITLAANPLSDTLVVGNAQDLTIDALVAKLVDSGTTLAQYVDNVAATSPAIPPTAMGSETPSLPADLLLKPAAASCAALRTGAYRVIALEVAAAGNASTEKIQVDAETLLVTNADTTTDTLLPLGVCHYTNSKAADIVVSQAGVIVVRSKNDAGAYRQVLAFPEQDLPVTALAEAWNVFGMDVSATPGTFDAFASAVTFDGTGKLTAASACSDLKTCTAVPAGSLPNVTLTKNTQGGFDFNDITGSTVERLFAYRTGGGELMVVNVAGDGSFSFWSRQRVNDLPPVGRVLRNWNSGLGSNLLSLGAISEDGNTILSTDTTARSITRSRIVTNGATVTETLLANNPRGGYTFRPAASTTDSAGNAFTIREFTSLSLRGAGLSAVALPVSGSSLANFTISVTQPGGPWLPANLIGKPYASNCAALRSGTVRFVEAYASTTGFATGTRIVDAPNLRLYLPDGVTLDTQLVANGPCRYTSGTTGNEVVFAQSGVASFRSVETDGIHVGLVFPEQPHVLADLAGTWNKMGFEQTTTVGTYAADAATATIDTTGAVSNISFCADVTNCVPVTGKTITHAANIVDGGFNRTSSDGWTDRVFAYQAGGGQLMLVNLGGDGSIGLWTPAADNALPLVGSRNRNFNVDINPQLKSPTAISTSESTISSVDATAKTYVRTRKTSTGAIYSETLSFNNPRSGYTFRPAATPTASNGSTVTVREFTALSMKGMGFSALTLPSTATASAIFEFSLTPP